MWHARRGGAKGSSAPINLDDVEVDRQVEVGGHPCSLGAHGGDLAVTTQEQLPGLLLVGQVLENA